MNINEDMIERRIPFRDLLENLLREAEYTEEVKRCGDCAYCVEDQSQYVCIAREKYKLPVKLEGCCRYFKKYNIESSKV